MGFDDLTARDTEAKNSGDAAEVAAFFAPGKGISINRGAERSGQEAMIAMAAGFMAACPDLKLSRDFYRLAGDRGVLGWTLESHHGETKNVAKPTGWEECTLNDAGQVTLSLGWFDAVDYDAQVNGQAG